MKSYRLKDMKGFMKVIVLEIEMRKEKKIFWAVFCLQPIPNKQLCIKRE